MSSPDNNYCSIIPIVGTFFKISKDLLQLVSSGVILTIPGHFLMISFRNPKKWPTVLLDMDQIWLNKITRVIHAFFKFCQKNICDHVKASAT